MKPHNELSPLDSRYKQKLEAVAEIFSEESIVRTQIAVEKAWILYLVRHTSLVINEFGGKLLPVNDKAIETALKPILSFNEQNSLISLDQIKRFEETTHHDIVAMAMYFKQLLVFDGVPKNVAEFVHFGLTSQDIVTTAYNVSAKKYLKDRFAVGMGMIFEALGDKRFDIKFVARTHGQPAIPTSFKKEFDGYIERMLIYTNNIENGISNMSTKFGGAINNFAAAKFCNPDINWDLVLDSFIKEFIGMERSKYGAQTDNYESLCGIFDNMAALCDIMIDLSRDIWTYCSMEYFNLKYPKGHVGSSTMIQKVNPIDFENGEGNLEVATMWMRFMSSKLRKSRLQRDLSDSTVMRNLGVIFGHFDLGMQNIRKGIDKLVVDKELVVDELNHNYQILAEPVQTKLKYAGVLDAFNNVKDLFKGKHMDSDAYKHAIDELDISIKLHKELRGLKPEDYYY